MEQALNMTTGARISIIVRLTVSALMTGVLLDGKLARQVRRGIPVATGIQQLDRQQGDFGGVPVVG
jgi:hypothetical protein